MELAGDMDLLAVISPETVEAWFEWGGYFILFGLLFACGLGLPMPEDIPLLLAGFFIASGKMNVAIACTLAWLGIIGGDCMLYSFGRRYGLEITRVPFIGKHVTKERILHAEELFERWGIWVVAIGRLFAGIRGAMVVAAGATRFSFVKFVIADGIAALISGGLFIALGYWLGGKLATPQEAWHRIEPYKNYAMIGMAFLAVLLILYFAWRAKRNRTLSQLAMEKIEHRIHPEPEE